MNQKNNNFSFNGRSISIDQLKSKEFDLVVVGGGITGAGVARDAASRGMTVALIEADDFASGTSSRSSKLIHGGIRYLENLEFHLVYEALSERKLLFQIAPHLVHPLRFMVPLFDGDRVGMFKMGLGMWLYDLLSLFEAPELHQRLSPRESTDKINILRSQGLKGSFIYSDAYMDDDRLVIETLRSAVGLGAVAVNFVRAESSLFENNKVSGLVCRDSISGSKFTVKGKHFVSTVGPWTDVVGSSLLPTWKRLLRPSKGIHITLERSRLPLTCAVVMAAGKDEKRIVFGIPRHEMIIIGTTDTDFKGDPAQVHSTEEDVKYLLKVVDNYFPGAKISHEDIIGSYSGVRPLVDDGSETESKTSREHVILSDSRNITFVAGGKYTTYRRMAADTVNACLKEFYSTEDRVRFARGMTKTPLNDKASVESLDRAIYDHDYIRKHTHLTEADSLLLAERHGLEAFDIVQRYNNKNIKSVWELEAHFAIDETCCGNLLDFYLRRAPLFLSKKDHGYDLLSSITDIFSSKLNWTDSERKSQQDRLRQHEKFEMSWKR